MEKGNLGITVLDFPRGFRLAAYICYLKKKDYLFWDEWIYLDPNDRRKKIKKYIYVGRKEIEEDKSVFSKIIDWIVR
jgi:hypothetical protein